jgi:hypothetical protein
MAHGTASTARNPSAVGRQRGVVLPADNVDPRTTATDDALDRQRTDPRRESAVRRISKGPARTPPQRANRPDSLTGERRRDNCVRRPQRHGGRVSTGQTQVLRPVRPTHGQQGWSTTTGQVTPYHPRTSGSTRDNRGVAASSDDGEKMVFGGGAFSRGLSPIPSRRAKDRR